MLSRGPSHLELLESALVVVGDAFWEGAEQCRQLSSSLHLHAVVQGLLALSEHPAFRAAFGAVLGTSLCPPPPVACLSGSASWGQGKGFIYHCVLSTRLDTNGKHCGLIKQMTGCDYYSPWPLTDAWDSCVDRLFFLRKKTSQDAWTSIFFWSNSCISTPLTTWCYLRGQLSWKFPHCSRSDKILSVLKHLLP